MRNHAVRLAAALLVPLALGAGCVSVPKPSGPAASAVPTFAVDAGIRIPDASNPLVVRHDGEAVTLAYEYRSDELKDQPRERVRVASSEDGMTFEEGQPWPEGLPVGPAGIALPDGSVRRYSFDQSRGALTSETLGADGAYRRDEGTRYVPPAPDSSEPNAVRFGVFTAFVDPDGGVVLLYNGSNAAGDVTVNRAYSEPGDNGMTFALTDEDILHGTLETEHYADPNAAVLPDGRAWLVVMNQADGPRPPMGRLGTLHGYLSEDGGRTFAYAGELFGWDDYGDLDAYSLNDPKAVLLPDGRLRIYVAAMIPNAANENGFGWAIVSATQDSAK